MSGSDARALSRSLLDLCRMRKLTIATAESCTGGLVAGALTDIPGSSDVIDRGFVTYSNEAKRAMLGVKATTLESFGAVSKETATAMAVGALERAGVDLAVSITGIAGPGGATPGKPVGLVHFAVAARDGRILHRECRFGAIGRSAVRARSVGDQPVEGELVLGILRTVRVGRCVAGRLEDEAQEDGAHGVVGHGPRPVHLLELALELVDRGQDLDVPGSSVGAVGRPGRHDGVHVGICRRKGGRGLHRLRR